MHNPPAHRNRDRKRQLLDSPQTILDMDKSDGKLQSQLPPNVPLLLNLSGMTILSEGVQDMDLNGDKTLINTYVPSSLSSMDSPDRELTPQPFITPVHKKKMDSI